MWSILLRLGTAHDRPGQPFLDAWAKAACFVAVGLYLLHGGYAVFTHRALYGDAAWFLVRIITEGDVTSFYSSFAREFYYSRFLAYALTQLPTVAAVNAGVEDARLLSWILGATYFAHKPLSLWLCYRLLPAGCKAYVMFPLLGLFAGSVNSELYIVTETHLAVSFLWPLLLAVTQVKQPSRWGFAAIASGLLASAFVYESMAFFGPVLLVLCAIRAYSVPRQRIGWIWLSICALVPICISWAAILYPRDPTNKSAFSNGMVKLFNDSLSGPATAHILAVTSIAAVAVVVALVLWGLRSRAKEEVPRWVWFVAATLACVPATHFVAYATHADFTYAITDRGFGGLLMQLAIVGLYLGVLVLPARSFVTAVPSAAIVVCGLAVGQIGWQLLATRAWQNSLHTLESVAALRPGLQECSPEVFGSATASAPAAAGIVCHWWVLPLSVVLAPDSGVRTLFVSQEPFLPFDPRNLEALPNSQDHAVDYAPYRRAYASDRNSPVPRYLDFTEKGSGPRHFRAGFSKPEAWATWTDGAQAQLELCFGRQTRTDPVLVFKVAPQVTTVRPALGVALDVDGEPAAAWAFKLGHGIVERSLTIPRRHLDGDGCAVVRFAFDDNRPASQLGVPNDPRRLGLAFISLQARY